MELTRPKSKRNVKQLLSREQYNSSRITQEELENRLKILKNYDRQNTFSAADEPEYYDDDAEIESDELVDRLNKLKNISSEDRNTKTNTFIRDEYNIAPLNDQQREDGIYSSQLISSQTSTFYPDLNQLNRQTSSRIYSDTSPFINPQTSTSQLYRPPTSNIYSDTSQLNRPPTSIYSDTRPFINPQTSTNQLYRPPISNIYPDINQLNRSSISNIYPNLNNIPQTTNSIYPNINQFNSQQQSATSYKYQLPSSSTNYNEQNNEPGSYFTIQKKSYYNSPLSPEQSCPVCGDKGRVFMTCCKNMLCYSCTKRWVKERKTCPKCFTPDYILPSAPPSNSDLIIADKIENLLNQLLEMLKRGYNEEERSNFAELVKELYALINIHYENTHDGPGQRPKGKPDITPLLEKFKKSIEAEANSNDRIDNQLARFNLAYAYNKGSSKNKLIDNIHDIIKDYKVVFKVLEMGLRYRYIMAPLNSICADLLFYMDILLVVRKGFLLSTGANSIKEWITGKQNQNQALKEALDTGNIEAYNSKKKSYFEFTLNFLKEKAKNFFLWENDKTIFYNDYNTFFEDKVDEVSTSNIGAKRGPQPRQSLVSRIFSKPTLPTLLGPNGTFQL